MLLFTPHNKLGLNNHNRDDHLQHRCLRFTPRKKLRLICFWSNKIFILEMQRLQNQPTSTKTLWISISLETTYLEYVVQRKIANKV